MSGLPACPAEAARFSSPVLCPGDEPVAWGGVGMSVSAVLQALLARRHGPSAARAEKAAGEGLRAGCAGAGAAPSARPAARRMPRVHHYAWWVKRWQKRPFPLKRSWGACRPILDVGCYDGALAAQLARSTGRVVVGLDITDAGFRQAYERARALGVADRVGCVRQDAHHAASLGRELFEAVTFTYSLHCMRSPRAVMAEVARALVPGGVILVVDWVVGEGERKHGCSRLRVSEVESMMRGAGLLPVHAVVDKGVALIAAEKPVPAPDPDPAAPPA